MKLFMLRQRQLSKDAWSRASRLVMFGCMSVSIESMCFYIKHSVLFLQGGNGNIPTLELEIHHAPHKVNIHGVSGLDIKSELSVP